ncbi:hypothetical protein B0H14DRAFT_3056244 [Mycena olivaceomarginata]|nr:hypothetical protein B0H14DRAFT_3056244 [Mycena olivaceomarginata]
MDKLVSRLQARFSRLAVSKPVITPYLEASDLATTALRTFAQLKSKIEFYASPPIASVVETCTIVGGHSNSPAYVAAICEALSRFPHLRGLSFDHVRMTIHTISGIARASHNRTCRSRWSPAFRISSQSEMWSFILEIFPSINDFHDVFPNDELWLRCLDLTVLRVLDLVRPHSTRAFMRSRVQLPALEVLDLHIAGLKELTEDRFISSLSCFPALRALNPAPPLVHWRLNSLSCPSNLLPAFSSDREIAHLNGYIKDLPSLLLEIGSHAIASFELHFVYPIDGLDAITEAFPALRSLRIVAYVPNYTMITAIAPWRLLHLTLRCTPRSPIPFWGAPGRRRPRPPLRFMTSRRQWPSLRQINLSREVYNPDGRVKKVVMISWPGLSINRTAKSRDPWELENITVASRSGKVPDTAWFEATRMHGYRYVPRR